MTLETDTQTYMTAPDRNGTPSLPKRAGTRTMVPTTWLARSLRVEFVGADGEAREATATLLDWCPLGLIVNIAGAKTVLCWDRLVLAELLEDR